MSGRRRIAVLAGGLASLALAVLGAAVPSGGGGKTDSDQRVYDVVYEARLLPSKGLARVAIQVDESGLLHRLSFNFDPQRAFRFQADGEVRVDGSHLVWELPETGGRLRYSVKVDHLRESAEYDARSTPAWALFRGSDLFPPSASRTVPGASARASLRLRLPESWTAETPFVRDEDGSYRLEQEDRRLDRPAGWMVAGKDLTVRRSSIAGVRVTIAGPADQGLRSRDVMLLLRLTLPELREIAGALPERLLIVGAGDPMWRGGLSGPGSLYLHTDRPLIEQDGSSPLLHEVLHAVMHAVSGAGGDWIVEGIAEYYSLELLLRSGGVGEEGHRESLERLSRRAADVEALATPRADRDVTARAVLVLDGLDQRIREATNGEKSLDDVVRALVGRREPVTSDSFRALVRQVAGAEVADSLPLPPESSRRDPVARKRDCRCCMGFSFAEVVGRPAPPLATSPGWHASCVLDDTHDERDEEVQTAWERAERPTRSRAVRRRLRVQPWTTKS